MIIFNSYYLCLAQYSQPFQDIKSPEVSSFERYGSRGISKYKGAPDISIPLHVISYGDITIPLEINYNTNGIRVDEEAGQFGLGWYFGTGMISQIRNGKNDLHQNVFVEQPDYYTGTMGYVIDPASGAIIRTPTTPNSSLNQYFVARIRDVGLVPDRFDCFMYFDRDGSFYYPKNNVAKNYTNVVNSIYYEDFEIDYFKANFFGHELTFFINPRNSISGSYTFCVINKDKYKIQLENNNWIITDPSGIKYYFEERKAAIVSSYPGGVGNPLNPSTPTSAVNLIGGSFSFNEYTENSSSIWKITKIKDTKGNEIIFNYSQLLDSRFTSSSNIYEIKNLNVGNSMIGSLTSNYQYLGPIDNALSYSSGVEDYGRHNIFKSTQRNSILSEIIFGDSKIKFNNTGRIDSPYDKKTENISILYKNQLIQSINFSYDYFNSSSSDDLQKRLKLTSLEIGNNNPYLFYYNSIDTPNKNTLSFDYWGFYNGMPNTTNISNPFRLFEDVSLIPLWAKPYITILDGKCNRSAHPDYCKAGMLEQINYPTGGYTKIEYELNEFDNYFFPDYNNKIGVDLDNNFTVNYTQNKSKGFGLRVKTIKNYINDSSYTSKQYIYYGGKHIPPYVGYRTNYVYYQKPGNGVDINSGSYSVITASGNNISSYSSLLYQNNLLGNGNSIGYNSIEEVEVSMGGDQNGKVVSYFTNIPDLSPVQKFDNGYSSSIGFNLEHFDKFGSSIRNSDIDNGLLVKEEYFDKNNNIVLRKDIGYSSFMYANTIRYNLKFVPIGTYFYTRKVGCSVNAGNDDTKIKTTFFNEYLLFYYPLKLAKTKKSFEKITDYFSSGNKETTTYYNYNSNNIPTGKYIRDANGNTIYSESTNMMSTTDLINKNILNLPLNTSILENGATKKSFNYLYQDVNNVTLLNKIEELPSGNPDPSPKINTFYDLYDDKNNLIQFHRENDIYTSVIWGYNKTLIVAKIENTQYSQIQSSLIQAVQSASDTGTETQLQTALDNLRNSLPDAMVTTYTHKPLVGVSWITDSKGDKRMYYYDSNNRLEFVKDKDGNILKEYDYHFRPQN